MTPWAQDPERLRGGSPGVGNRAEAECTSDGVEAVVREIKCLHIPKAEIRGMGELLCALAGDRKHPGTQLDPRELDVVSVEGQISRRAAGQLEDPPPCL